MTFSINSACTRKHSKLKTHLCILRWAGLQMLHTLLIARFSRFRLVQLPMTVSFRPTHCTKLAAQRRCVALFFNLLQQFCFALAKPVVRCTQVLMIHEQCHRWLLRQYALHACIAVRTLTAECKQRKAVEWSLLVSDNICITKFQPVGSNSNPMH